MRGRRSPFSRAVLVFLLVALALVPVAWAHGADPKLEDQLISNGQKLVVGRFTAPQPGPLVVVPFVETTPACAGAPSSGATLALGLDASVTFFVAADGLHALFDLPPDPTGYAALAVDTHDASRALILMEENAVALHALEAVAFRDGNDTNATGVLGVPYALPGGHGHIDVKPEGGGLLIDHDDRFLGGRMCAGDVPGHRAFAFFASALPESVTPGRIVHIVALHDPDVPYLLPRPIDASTRVVQANLYLARAGEDPASVRAAFSPSWSLADAAPLALVGLGIVWAGRRGPSQP